jgi:hypothetical protein
MERWQGTIHALLTECYELLHKLRSEIEEDPYVLCFVLDLWIRN